MTTPHGPPLARLLDGTADAVAAVRFRNDDIFQI